MTVRDLPLPQSSLGACSWASGGCGSCGARAPVSGRAGFVLGLHAPLAPRNLLHVLSSEVFPPGARASGRGLAHQPPAGWCGPRRRWCGGSPEATQPTAMKGGPGPLGGRAVTLRPLPAPWSRLPWGRLDGEDRCPRRTGCSPPPLVMMEHTRLLLGEDRMNINAPYFTSIAFLLGFHGDGACE